MLKLSKHRPPISAGPVAFATPRTLLMRPCVAVWPQAGGDGVAVCCCVLQAGGDGIAVCCCVLQAGGDGVAVCCRQVVMVLLCVAVCCRQVVMVLLCVAVCCRQVVMVLTQSDGRADYTVSHSLRHRVASVGLGLGDWAPGQCHVPPLASDYLYALHLPRPI